MFLAEGATADLAGWPRTIAVAATFVTAREGLVT